MRRVLYSLPDSEVCKECVHKKDVHFEGEDMVECTIACIDNTGMVCSQYVSPTLTICKEDLKCAIAVSDYNGNPTLLVDKIWKALGGTIDESRGKS